MYLFLTRRQRPATGFAYATHMSSLRALVFLRLMQTSSMPLRLQLGVLFSTQHTKPPLRVESTGSFFVDNEHVITSSDILFPSHVAVPPLEAIQYQSCSFSRRAMLDSGNFPSPHISFFYVYQGVFLLLVCVGEMFLCEIAGGKQ